MSRKKQNIAPKRLVEPSRTIAPKRLVEPPASPAPKRLIDTSSSPSIGSAAQRIINRNTPSTDAIMAVRKTVDAVTNAGRFDSFRSDGIRSALDPLSGYMNRPTPPVAINMSRAAGAAPNLQPQPMASISATPGQNWDARTNRRNTHSADAQQERAREAITPEIITRYYEARRPYITTGPWGGRTNTYFTQEEYAQARRDLLAEQLRSNGELDQPTQNTSTSVHRQKLAEMEAELEELKASNKQVVAYKEGGVRGETTIESYAGTNNDAIKELAAEIDATRANIWNQENETKYNALKQSPYFSQLSGGEWADKLETSNPLAFGRQKYQYMTEDEKSIYNYLYNTGGEESADEYLDWLKYSLNERSMGRQVDIVRENANKSGTGSSALSVSNSALGGVLSWADILAQRAAKEIREDVTGEYAGPIDYNTMWQAPANYARAQRETVSQNIADTTGVIQLNEEEHPILAPVLNGKSLADVYQLGMGMADSVVSMAMGGRAGSVLLGSSAGSAAMMDAVERGATDDQAITMGILSGGIEMLTEAISIDKLLSYNGTNILKAMAAQGIVEASEEGASNIANTIADVIVMAERSNWRQNINQYIEQGMSQAEAEKAAFRDACIEFGWDVIGGSLSGGVFGAGNAVINNISGGVNRPTAQATTSAPSPTTQTMTEAERAEQIRQEASNRWDAKAAAREEAAQQSAADRLINRNDAQTAQEAAGAPQAFGNIPAAPTGESAAMGEFNSQSAYSTNHAAFTKPTTQQNIDNAVTSAHNINNENLTEGGVANAEQGTYRTGSAGNPEARLGGLQGYVGGRPGAVEGSFGSELLRISPELSQSYEQSGIVPRTLVDSSGDSAAFASALDAARISDRDNGWAVTPKSVDTIRNDNLRTFMTEDGNAGFAVAPDGDIQAVFRNQNSDPGALDTLIPAALENGGTMLDCYGDRLARLYSRYGFVPVARVVFNENYANDGWDSSKGTPYIYFMRHNGTSAAQTLANKGKTTVTLQRLEALPTFNAETGYDEAWAYRDMLMGRSNSQPAASDTGDGLFDPAKGPGAGGVRTGPQVPSQNNLTMSRNLDAEAQQHIADSTPTHEQVSERLANTRADALMVMDSDGNWINLQDSMADLRADVESGRVLAPEQVKLAERAVTELSRKSRESGDWSEFERFNSEVISKAKTDAGQSLQAWAEYSRSAAATISTAANILGDVKASDETLSKVSEYAEKAQSLMEAKDADRLRNLVRAISKERGYNPEGRRVRRALDRTTDVNQLYELAQVSALGIAFDQTKASWGQRISTYQTMSHMLNLKSYLRNELCNQVFAPLDSITNLPALLADSALALFDFSGSGLNYSQRRTVSLEATRLNRNVRNTQREYVDQAVIDNALDINRGFAKNKYNSPDARPTNRTFKRNGNAVNRILNRGEGLMGYELNVSDARQKGRTKGQVEEAMRKLVDKNGRITQNVADKIVEDKMLYRSFQRDTTIGKGLALFKNVLNKFGISHKVVAGIGHKDMDTHSFGLGDVIAKYTTVPGAIIHTVADYTPIGMLNTISDIAQMAEARRADPDAMSKRAAYKGLTNAEAAAIAQHNAAVSLGRQMTGAGVITLGQYLLKAGVLLLNAYGGDDKDEDEAKSSEGLSGFQMNLSAIGRFVAGKDTAPRKGDILIDISQVQPFSVLLQTGALMASTEDDEEAWDILAACAQSLYEQISDLPIMSTAQTIINNIKYRGDESTWDTIGNIVTDIATDAMTGFIPGPIRQTATAMDRYRRDTSADGPVERILNTAKGVIPGLRQTLPTRTDVSGNPKEYTGNAALDAANAFINPASVNIYRPVETIAYQERISEATGGSLFPAAYAPRSFTIKEDGENSKYELTADERRQYEQTYKSTYYAATKDLMDRPWAQSITDEAAAEILSELRSYANTKARDEVITGRGGEVEERELKSLDDPVGYLALKAGFSEAEDSVGEDIATLNAANQWYNNSSDNDTDYALEHISGFKKYIEAMHAGLSDTDYFGLKSVMSQLEPLPGAESVSAQQKYELITGSEKSPQTKLAALSVYASESAYGYYEAAHNAGINLDKWTDTLGEISALQRSEGKTSNTVSQAELIAACWLCDISEAQTQAMYNAYATERGWKTTYWNAYSGAAELYNKYR